MQNFALIGVAGFIAPRHLKAIKETGNRLVAALDPFDSVGILDSYFPDCAFFTEFERFDRHAERLKETPDRIDYVTVCSPNYLHDAHVRFGLRIGANVICEKPLVLNPWNIDALERLEQESGRQVFNIFQLRLHPAIVELKRRVEGLDNEGAKGFSVPERSRRGGEGATDFQNLCDPSCEPSRPLWLNSNKIYDIDLTYITARGNWYYTSWKGDVSRSGGVATNIGVHFYDMLAWVFGEVEENIVHVSSHDRVSGYLLFKKARVRYFLSINYDTLPEDIKASGKRTFRSMKMNGEEIEFSDGFTDLHTESYRQILAGNGFRLSEARTSINLVHTIRHAQPIGLQGDYHPFAALPVTAHPFKTRN
ncbi:MAG: Gfo/Idh/MocA family oxidoreductase [Prolixibacteraceae bacterium]|jgi:UDP-N-acetyl-2-amino-2-deoxyglucuronate dehydrogenase|nr:Gfo/Idh/MocA family oxidoreductase [Prolixibacteraceae bacterium]